MADARQAVAPHFVVCVINDNIILRCLLSKGAVYVVSDVVELTRPHEPAAVPPYFMRCMLYSPNLVADDYPHFAWDAELDIDGGTYYIGCVQRRCDVLDRRFVLNDAPRQVQLRLHRLRTAPVRSPAATDLSQHLLALFQDAEFNPRGGSLPLQAIAEECQRKFPVEYRKVVGGEFLGSFRAFVASHDDSFTIFHYGRDEIDHRQMVNVSPHDERVAIRKEVRDMSPPLLPGGHEYEQKIIDLIRERLRDRDSQLHRLLHELSHHEAFRIGLSAGFSALMHWLQRHRNIFCWSTDPQSVCVIGLVSRAPQSVSLPMAPPVPPQPGQEGAEGAEEPETAAMAMLGLQDDLEGARGEATQ